jgi:CheY-like chemotaxis protein
MTIIGKPVDVLLVEDNESDIELIEEVLEGKRSGTISIWLKMEKM